VIAKITIFSPCYLLANTTLSLPFWLAKTDAETGRMAGAVQAAYGVGG